MNDPPRLEFPCAYPIKVIGDHSAGFTAAVLAVFSRVLAVEALDSSVRRSSGCRFTAVTVTITATGPEQLAALHEELKGVAGVRLVL